MSKTYRDVGIILKKFDLGEADAILTILTRAEGLVRCVAKGSKRITSRKLGNIEQFNCIDALFAKGKQLDILSEATAIQTYMSWRDDLVRVSQAYYVADLTQMLLAEGETYPYIFDQLDQCYRHLGKAQWPSVMVRWYEVQILFSLGFWAPDQLSSESANALTLLGHFSQMSASAVSQIKVSPTLDLELERIMRGCMMDVLEKSLKTEAFVYQVRALT